MRNVVREAAWERFADNRMVRADLVKNYTFGFWGLFAMSLATGRSREIIGHDLPAKVSGVAEDIAAQGSDVREWGSAQGKKLQGIMSLVGEAQDELDSEAPDTDREYIPEQLENARYGNDKKEIEPFEMMLEIHDVSD